MRRPTLDRNLLSIALGIYLSKERVGLVENKAKDVATAIGISESLYRMIESGTARIHPKYIMDFMRVFNASNIQFDAFAELIILIQHLDSFVVGKTPDSFLGAVKILREKETKHRKFLEPIEKLLEKPGEIKDNIIVEGEMIAMIENIRSFLSSSNYFDKSPIKVQEDKIARIFKNLPTIYYDFIGSIIDNLLIMPMGFRKDDLWKWEKFNQPKFVFMYGIVSDKNSIIDEGNFRTYKYEFLWLDTFKEAHMVFVGKHKPESLKEEFSEKLKEAIKDDAGKLIEFDKRIKKLNFHSTTNTELVNKILRPSENTEDKYSIAWVFILDTKVEVGLKSKYAGEAFTEFISLNFEESQELLGQINQLINEKV